MLIIYIKFYLTESLNCLKKPSSCGHFANANITYSLPILLQHFPTYRASDSVCKVHDSPKIERYKENHDVLSKESTELLGNIRDKNQFISVYNFFLPFRKTT